MKSHSFAELDIDNLIEELESFTYQILLHLLLIDYWTSESERNRNHWRSQINGFQYQLQNRLTTNLSSNLNKIYNKAKKGAGLKTGLGLGHFLGLFHSITNK